MQYLKGKANQATKKQEKYLLCPTRSPLQKTAGAQGVKIFEAVTGDGNVHEAEMLSAIIGGKASDVSREQLPKNERRRNVGRG